MLVSLSHAVGDYLQNVFFLQLNWWVLLGYVGQSLFAMRFIVQWVASERVGRSVIPFSSSAKGLACSCICAISISFFASVNRCRYHDPTKGCLGGASTRAGNS